MDTENNNNYETVTIEGEVWAVTTEGKGTPSESETASSSDVAGDEVSEPEHSVAGNSDSVDTEEITAGTEEIEGRAAIPDSADVDEAAGDEQTEVMAEPDFDALRALTSLLVGGAIEGTSQLTTRLQRYQEAIRQEAAEFGEEGGEGDAVDEDELVRLRYALVGLIFDAQATFRRNVSLWAKLADRSTRVTNRVTQPVTNSFFFNPVRRRYNDLIRRGEESLARWIEDGRIEEPPSRQLASRTYVEIVDEFIDRLAQNPQLQAVITKQSISVASDMRDEVRERTVTADNLMEGLVRRILRRTPRAELPEPPPEVQKWAGLTLEEYKAQLQIDENNDEPS
jgi:hypothetical protein